MVEAKSKPQKVVEYYVLCNRLKNIIRTGWLNWHVEKGRLESIAEHIYGVQMLAIAMSQTYNYDIDLYKVILMLAIHETEEIFIGDIPVFDPKHKEKVAKGHEAVHKIFECILSAPALEQLILEFDERKTKEALFAYQCDKLECDLQAKTYGDNKRVDLTKQDDNLSAKDPRVRPLLDEGYSFGKMWLQVGQNMYPYDRHFKAVSNYAKKHNIKKLEKRLKKEENRY